MTEPSGIQSDVPGLLVNARDIGVRRGERWIIRHVDLKVTRGELVYLIGANGAGKSTCLKAVLGLLDVDEGHVARAPSLEVGYVPQRLPVTPTLPLTLRRLMTLTGRFAADRIDAALSAVGLERLGDPPVTTLSGGEFQRLLLAQALIHRPDLLVLDEPEQGVDATGTDVVHELIEGIRRDLGCGVLIVSHDLRQAMATGDDLVVLVPHEHDDPPFGISGFKGLGSGGGDSSSVS
ncbi:MAG: metal ABC transporter ATP-binding protein [Deltaproteobacteria bacterium]|nr:metal ABC transporter ATP-binding protein [Deltaproteobacteria bacterium]